MQIMLYLIKLHLKAFETMFKSLKLMLKPCIAHHPLSSRFQRILYQLVKVTTYSRIKAIVSRLNSISNSIDGGAKEYLQQA